MLDDLIKHLREDVGKVKEPKAQALFETSAEVLGGLQMAHEARGNFCMLLGSLLLLVVGAGVSSLDARIATVRALLNRTKI